MNDVRRENNKGITLITLIIMVTILLILITVTLDIILGGDFFNKSKNTVDEANSKIETQKEQEKNIISTWNELPGKPIKGNTNQ